MLLKKFIFFSFLLLLVSISVYSSSENQQDPSKNSHVFSWFSTEDERDELMRTFLSDHEKFATEDLINDIVKLTDGYAMLQFVDFLNDIMSASKTNVLQRTICLKRLKDGAVEIHKPPESLPYDFGWPPKGDIVPYDADAVFPTADERLRIMKEILLENETSASEFLINGIVKRTSGFEMFDYRDWVTAMVKASETGSLDQDRYLKCPMADERRGVVEEILLLVKKSASESLIQEIVELTEYYDVHTVKKLVISMAKKSKTDSLDRNSCIGKLKKAINSIDLEHIKKFKLAQIEAITARKSLPKEGDEQETITKNRKGKKYPLLNDVFHENKILFTDAVKRLKKGKLIDESQRGILLYGPPGVGKNAMVEAIANESDCYIFRIKASGLVDPYQGSGAKKIHSIFSEAKKKLVETGKGVIVLIDELQTLAPVTTDKNVGPAHKHSGQDYNSTLAQIWTEYDECLRDNDNILIIVTCNKFELIDKRIRDRLKCIKFSYPDRKGIVEILINKSKHYDIILSESELKGYVKRMDGLSGRELTNFINDTETYIRSGKRKEEALELSAADQFKTRDDARLQEQPEGGWKEKIWAIGGDIVKMVATNYIQGAALRLGVNLSRGGTSNQEPSESPSPDTTRLAENPALEDLIKRQRRNRGQ